MTDRPLFQSAHNALLFAFTFAAQQYAVAAAAERAIALSARERYRELQDRVESRGLAGIDRAAIGWGDTPAAAYAAWVGAKIRGYVPWRGRRVAVAASNRGKA